MNILIHHKAQLDFFCQAPSFPLNEVNFYTQNIGAMERAIELKLKKVSFLDLRISSVKYSQIQIEADRIARFIDFELSNIRRKYFQIEETIGWDYQYLYWIILKVLRHSENNIQLMDQLTNIDKIYFVRNDAPQDYYFVSHILADLYAYFFKKNSRNYGVINIDQQGLTKDIGVSYQLYFPENIAEYRSIVHLPTVFYNKEQVIEELKSQYGDLYIDIESPYFDVPYSYQRIKLQKGSSTFNQKFSSEMREFLSRAYSRFNYGDILNGTIHRQITRAHSQVNLYKKLSDSPISVEKIYLSDHDTGLQGPLLSYANHTEIPVVMYPHSSYAVMPTAVIKNGYKVGLVSDLDSYPDLGGDSSSFKFENLVFSGKKSTGKVVILLNELDDTTQLPPESSVAIIRAALTICKIIHGQGKEVGLRVKPRHSYKNVIAGIFRQEFKDASFDKLMFLDGDIDALAQGTACCIGLGMPSTALKYFMKSGARLIQVSDMCFFGMDYHTVPKGTPIYGVDYFLKNINLILND